MLNAAPRQQASRPDTCWARRALTSYYCDAFRGPPCPIARAGQTQDVVGRVQSDRSAVSDHGPVPQSASSFDPPLGGSKKLAHLIVRPGFLAVDVLLVTTTLDLLAWATLDLLAMATLDLLAMATLDLLAMVVLDLEGSCATNIARFR